MTLSADGANIVFSWVNNGQASVYQANIDGSEPEILAESEAGISFLNPKVSTSGNKIVFVGFEEGAVNSSVWMINKDGSGMKQLTDNKTIRTEAMFSLSEDSVFFCQANDYKSYSPIGRRAAHSYDIYSLSMANGVVDKITNLASYGLYYITNFSNNEIIFNSIDTEEGLFIFSKSGDSIRRIIPRNKGDRDMLSYSNPVVIDSTLIACSSYYELLLIDLKTGEEKEIGRSPSGEFRSLSFNKGDKRLYFIVSGKKNRVFSINLDGTGLNEIPLDIK
ncbi:TolB family protein [Arcticibacter tournemirensis]|nr:hypothetical protein [Arcticibacter tournemirensis]